MNNQERIAAIAAQCDPHKLVAGHVVGEDRNLRLVRELCEIAADQETRLQALESALGVEMDLSGPGPDQVEQRPRTDNDVKRRKS
jgi:hypothetical protein